MRVKTLVPGNRGLVITMLLGLLWALAIKVNASSVATASSGQNVTLTLLDCEDNSQLSPRIKAWDVTNDSEHSIKIEPTVNIIEPYTTTARFRLPIGTYQIGIVQGKCDGMFDITILAGLDRNLTIALRKMVIVDYHNHNSLAGRLPFSGVQASLWYCWTGKCDIRQPSNFDVIPVVVDGQAYYVNQLAPGVWYLELFFPSSRSRILVPISNTDKKDMFYAHFELDFSARELQQFWQQQQSR